MHETGFDIFFVEQSLGVMKEQKPTGVLCIFGIQ